jgi:L-threonylcarbamoyladenylate synthase
VVLRVDPAGCAPDTLAPAVAFLREGGIVAFPTDTLYGFAVDPGSAAAVSALFALKGRAAQAAIPFVGASTDQVRDWCGLSPLSRTLADAFWPGPLSLVCDAPAGLAPAVHAGLGTVAIRVPDHPVARALALAWGSPLPATSANRTGEAAAVEAAELAGLTGPTLLVIDGGRTTGGPPSTIVDARRAPPRLVREGAIPWERVLHSIQQ